jgi:hypothetical protein
MAILVTTLCERADDHGGRRRPTATLWPLYLVEVDQMVAKGVRAMYIRSSIMSHITFKMCQFVLKIYFRDYQYDFDLDMLCYGLVMVYFNLLILHIKIYVRLITFSDDFSCLRIYISDYPGIFLYFLHVQDSIMIRFHTEEHIRRIRIFSCFSSFR